MLPLEHQILTHGLKWQEHPFGGWGSLFSVTADSACTMKCGPSAKRTHLYVRSKRPPDSWFIHKEKYSGRKIKSQWAVTITVGISHFSLTRYLESIRCDKIEVTWLFYPVGLIKHFVHFLYLFYVPWIIFCIYPFSLHGNVNKCTMLVRANTAFSKPNSWSKSPSLGQFKIHHSSFSKVFHNTRGWPHFLFQLTILQFYDDSEQTLAMCLVVLI